MAGKWCTVTVTDESGRRQTLDVEATSTYDAAHLYVTHAKDQASQRMSLCDFWKLSLQSFRQM